MIEWNTSCPDWEDRIIKGESLIPFDPLFPESAKKALEIFCSLRIVDQPGRPTFGEISPKWVLDFVAAVFGAYDQNTGIQHIKEYFLMIGKKNGKSTLASGVMMTALILNLRESAEFIVLAPTVKVANNSFQPAYDMCRKDVDEDLNSLLHDQAHLKKITNRNTKAWLNVVAADSGTVAGIKGSGHFIDELWEFGSGNNAKNMIREATGGMASRPEGFIIWATTQSDNPPAGIFKEKLDYARKVRDGKIKDNQFLPVIYEFPEKIIKESRHLNPKMFYVTNPNMGVSVDEGFLQREFKKAQEAGKDSMQGFLAKHLNIEIDVSLKTQNWAGAEFWEDAKNIVDLDIILQESEVIEIGIDGGGLDDLLGFAVIGRDASTGIWRLWVRAWANLIALERRKSEADRYRDFEKDGDLIIVEEIGEDIKQLGELVRKCEKSGLLDRIGVDQAGIGTIVDELEAGDENEEYAIDHDRIIGIPQGWRLNGAIKTAGIKIAGKGMVHGGQRLMSWCVGNAKEEQKGNAIAITKQTCGTGKIDPFMAMLNAVTLMAMNPIAKAVKSAYNDMTPEEIEDSTLTF